METSKINVSMSSNNIRNSNILNDVLFWLTMSVLLVASLLSTVYIFETNRLYEGGNHKYMLAPGAFLISFTIFAMILLVLFIIFKLTNKHNIHYNNNFFCQGIKKLGIFFDIFMYVNSIGSLVLTLCALIRSTGSTNIIFIILVIIFWITILVIFIGAYVKYLIKNEKLKVKVKVTAK